MVLPRVRSCDDNAHRFLIETFEPAVALQVFQMAAECAVPRKLIGLFARDQAGRQKALDALPPHRPAFAFGESLAQKGKI